MSYLDRIDACNAHDLGRYVPWYVGDQRVGWLRKDRLALLRDFDCFVVGQAEVRMRPDLADPAARTAAVDAVVDRLVEKGAMKGRRGEFYAVKPRWRDPSLLELDRGAVPWFGVRAYGIHLSGLVRNGDEVSVWVARRSRDKITYPGQLDNTVAGGQPAGLTLRENLRKECEEEAGIPAALSAAAVPVGIITYCTEREGGLKPDCMFVFDLELPASFEPHCRDGEVESFERWSLPRLAEAVRETDAFKFNSALCAIDLLVRHGELDPQDPDYVEVVRGLRSWGGG